MVSFLTQEEKLLAQISLTQEEKVGITELLAQSFQETFLGAPIENLVLLFERALVLEQDTRNKILLYLVPRYPYEFLNPKIIERITSLSFQRVLESGLKSGYKGNSLLQLSLKIFSLRAQGDSELIKLVNSNLLLFDCDLPSRSYLEVLLQNYTSQKDMVAAKYVFELLQELDK